LYPLRWLGRIDQVTRTVEDGDDHFAVFFRKAAGVDESLEQLGAELHLVDLQTFTDELGVIYRSIGGSALYWC
jgi:hypothetical protein